MTPEHTLNNPLILIRIGEGYKVSKPNQETQSLVGRQYAINYADKYAEKRVKEEKVKLLQELISANEVRMCSAASNNYHIGFNDGIHETLSSLKQELNKLKGE